MLNLNKHNYLLTIILTLLSETSKVPAENLLSFHVDTKEVPYIQINKGKSVNLGNFSKQQDVAIKMSNKAFKNISIKTWRSPCPCLIVKSMPSNIAPGKTEKLTLRILPDGYSGRIYKHFPLTIKYGSSHKILFIPISFIAGDIAQVQNKTDEWISKAALNNVESVTYIKYNGGKVNDKRYAGAIAWIFGGKNCAQCNYLKKIIFPKVFNYPDKIVEVNLNNKDGLLLLMGLEKRFNIIKPKDPPVLFWKSKLFYGSAIIKNQLLNKNI